MDYCFHNAPCKNDGKCSSGGRQNFYYCNCSKEYTGRNCEYLVSFVINELLLKDGQKLWLSEMQLFISYIEVQIWEHCYHIFPVPLSNEFLFTFQVDPCKNLDCGPFGKCMTNNFKSECFCNAMYYGDRCQYKILDTPTRNESEHHIE